MDLLVPIIDHMEDALVITDKQGKIVLFNNKALSLSQQFLHEPLSPDRQIMYLLMDSREETVQEIYQNINRYKKPERTFVEYNHQSNATTFLEFLYTPVLEDSGSITQVLIFIRDITHQKVFEKKLVNTIENTRHLIETANALIIGLDTRGYITDWNAHCTQVTGYEKNDVFSRKLSEFLLPPEVKDSFRTTMQRVLGREEINQFGMPVRDKQGNQIEILTSFSPRYSITGEIVGVIMVAQDITELAEYRKSLEQQVQLRTQELKAALKREQEIVEVKSRFVSMASHEFRTPLNTLKFTLQKLTDNQRDELQFQDRIKNMEKQVDHMLYLLDDFLAYSKQEPGKIKLTISPINVLEFLERLREEVCRVTNFTHNISITWEGVSEIHHSDEKLFRSIITNLLTNAVKFSPGKKNVTVTLSKTEQGLAMTVTDEGIGMSKQELEKAFEPFTRSEKVSNIPGTGLGLSIVNRAVSLLQGEITIQSQPGKGTKVCIQLPNLYEHQT